VLTKLAALTREEKARGVISGIEMPHVTQARRRENS